MNVTKAISKGRVVITILTLLLTMWNISPLWEAVDGSIEVSPSTIFIDGDWIVSDTNITGNKEIILNGNLLVTSTGNLTLNNVVLRINQTASKQHRINVESGGSLYVLGGCGVTSNNSYYYLFTVYGKLRLDNSKVSMTEVLPGSWGGIHVFSDEVYISNSTIYQFEGAGITAEGKNLTVYNTTFCEGYRGILIEAQSNLTVERCTFRQLGDTGIDASGYCTVHVSHSNFYDIACWGVLAHWYVSATVSNCSFINVSEKTINVIAHATLFLNDSTFENNDFYAIYIWGHSVAYIRNISINGSDNAVAVRLYSNATILNSNIIDNTQCGVSVSQSNATITNCTIEENGAGVHVNAYSNVTVLNSTVKNNIGDFDVGGYSWVFVKWFLHARVIDLNGNPIPNANMKVYDFFNDLVFKGFTGIDGWRRWIVLTNRSIYKPGATDPIELTYYTPHNITAEYNTATNTTEGTMDVSKEVVIKLDIELDSIDLLLSEGWNLISLPVIPHRNSLDKVLWSIVGKWDCIQVYNATDPDHWKSNCTHKPIQLNDLNSLNHRIGFWIHITEPNVTLTLYGEEPSSTTIPLYAGWNLVGYPTFNDTESVANALWGTGADRVEMYDPLAPYRIKEVGPTYIMKPGEGYWIHVPVDTVWIVDW